MSRQLKSACEYLSIRSEPMVKIDYDTGRGRGLVATRTIRKGEPVVIYYGTIVRDDGETHMQMYLDDPEGYLLDVAPYVRSNGAVSVDAREVARRGSSGLNLMGVLVNDYARLEDVDQDSIRSYVGSQALCNLEVGPVTRDYPVYFAKRRIRKGEELTVHYGLAYWLLQLGVHPSELKSYLDLSV